MLISTSKCFTDSQKNCTTMVKNHGFEQFCSLRKNFGCLFTSLALIPSTHKWSVLDFFLFWTMLKMLAIYSQQFFTSVKGPSFSRHLSQNIYAIFITTWPLGFLQFRLVVYTIFGKYLQIWFSISITGWQVLFHKFGHKKLFLAHYAEFSLQESSFEGKNKK